MQKAAAAKVNAIFGAAEGQPPADNGRAKERGRVLRLATEWLQNRSWWAAGLKNKGPTSGSRVGLYAK
jgi:hypothetical protein